MTQKLAPYELLDCGEGRKLERLGKWLLDRQAPQAVWSKRHPDLWRKADGHHVRKTTGGGRWEWRRKPPEEWRIHHAGLDFVLKPTPFGHMGLFAEQGEQWTWLRRVIPEIAGRLGRPPKLLNLFAYSGGSTLAGAQAGAEMTHVDAARGIVTWARENAEINDLTTAPIRWIVEDCLRYLNRECKRAHRYDGVILDPPSFGRGAKGEVFKIEEHLAPLLTTLRELVGARPSLLLLSGHTPGYTPLALGNVVREHFDIDSSDLELGEMVIREVEGDRVLPSGAFARVGSSE